MPVEKSAGFYCVCVCVCVCVHNDIILINDACREIGGCAPGDEWLGAGVELHELLLVYVYDMCYVCMYVCMCVCVCVCVRVCVCMLCHM
jgi:hypothetical protein